MIIISPAKRQNLESHARSVDFPVNLDKSADLVEILAAFDEKSLAKCLNVSEQLGKQAWEQYQYFLKNGFEPALAIAAIDLYQGDVFKHLQVETLTDEDMVYMQKNLRILSALYGVLKPLDGIWPYRLEMTSSILSNKKLASYWQEVACRQLTAENPEYIFNLASVAYSEMVPRNNSAKWIDIVFQDKDKVGNYKVVAVKAKRMRGRILRYMIQQKVKHPEELLRFSQDQYVICEEVSSPERLVYRSEQ